MSLLGDRVLAVDAALSRAGLPHALGGALAYAYCAREARATQDMDVNVFVGTDRVDAVLDALPDEIRISKSDRGLLSRNGQVRLYWEQTPVDIFLVTHPFHLDVAKRAREVPFEGRHIQIIACADLVVFKAMFNRTKDWGDIEEMVAARTFDGPQVLDTLRSLLGPGDPAVVRLGALVAGM